MKKMNRKGSTLDNIMVLIKVFSFSLFILIILLAWDKFTSDQMDAQIWDKTEEGKHIRENTTVAINNLDWIFLVAYFGLHVGIIVLAFFLRSHPIVYVAGIFVIIILVMVSAPLSNEWNNILADEEFSTVITKVPKTDFIMDKLPIFEVIFAFLTLISLAAFARSEQYI